MTKPIITIFDCETNETVVREMTSAEFAQWEKDQETAEIRKAEVQARATQRQALLDRLGITEAEARLLLG